MRLIHETPAGDFLELPSDPARILNGSPTPWARAANAPFLTPVPDAIPSSIAHRLVIRSGWLPTDDAPDHPDPRTWGPRGWQALEDALAPYLARDGPRLLIRPAWTDVISDTPSCLRFLDRREQWGSANERLGILLDPIAMIAPSMLHTAEDHVRRILEIVAPRPGVDAVAIANLSADGARTELHRGVIPPERLATLYRDLITPETPVVLADNDVAAQAELLRAS